MVKKASRDGEVYVIPGELDIKRSIEDTNEITQN